MAEPQAFPMKSGHQQKRRGRASSIEGHGAFFADGLASGTGCLYVEWVPLHGGGGGGAWDLDAK